MTVLDALDALDAAAVRRWCERGAAALSTARASIDDLNVYPVPDGDTGTNLALTMRAVVEAVHAAGDGNGAEPLAHVARAMARGALLGARGNSGAILAQMLRGVADVLAASEPVGGRELQAALARAADLAHASVETPVEGTVLTVARAAAEAAAAVGAPVPPGPDRSGPHARAAAGPGPALADVARAAARGAADALARTPDQLDVLADAGVVDAGGRGLCVLLDALADVVAGREPAAAGTGGDPFALPEPAPAGTATREAGSAHLGYEVQYLLALEERADPEREVIAALRARLAALGDSLVVVGGEGLWAVHVHVADVGAAVEAGVDAGRPSRITVTRFADRIEADRALADRAEVDRAEARDRLPGPGPDARAGRCVVAVVPGPGLADLAREAGAVVVAAGPAGPPSADDLVAAVLGRDDPEVVLVPADEPGCAVAQQAARAVRALGRTVTVVPTRSVVQGLAALAVADPGRPFADDAVAMTSAAAATRWAGVEVAAEQAQTSAGVCERGDILGLVEGDVILIGDEVGQVARELLDRMLLVGGELVTLVTAADAPAVRAGGEDPVDLGSHLTEYLRAVHPGLDVVAYGGGPAGVPLLVGVE